MNVTYRLLLLIFLSLWVEKNFGQELLKLWEPGTKPHYKENSLQEFEKEEWGTMNAYHITEPTMTIYAAQGKNTGKSVLILPGGGYRLVAIHHEGYDLAEVLSAQGITAAVLKYRLPDTLSSDAPHMVPLADTRRALKILRTKAEAYSFDPAKVGVLGFSAGSHLATVASLWKSDESEENPNFSALIYGVTNLKADNMDWLEKSLYYRKMTAEEIEQNTLLNLVTEESPPAFLVHAYDDPVCHVTESTLYAQELFKQKVPVEMHLFPKGGHGFGMGRTKGGVSQWVQLFVNWLASADI
ncbi:MAG: alpha/beta hydrolase [Bacteroidota bacterium]